MTRLFAGLAGRVRLGVLGLMLAAGGLAAVSFAEYRAVRRIQTEFVPVTATVESLYLADGVGTDDQNRLAFTFTPAVRYRFRIGDEVYTGDRVYFRDQSIVGWAAADEFRTRYAPGASVECFHDPADPTDSILVKPASAEDAVGRMRVSAVLFLLAAVGGLVFELTTGKTASRPAARRRLDWGEDVTGRDPLARTRRMYRDKLEET